MSLTEEREAQLKASLAYYIRIVGFTVQLESYFYDEPASRRPDLAIWLPITRRYLFLELKTIGPYAGFNAAIDDIIKLENVSSSRDKRNGLIAIGFRNPIGPRERFLQKYDKLSQVITKEHPYREIGVKKIELDDMDEQAVYAMVGFWVRKLRT
jgi:hypothetical protein